ncbi:MAG: Maf family protein [Bacteroidota bacterium]
MNLSHPLILASNSPRRHQLLKDLGVDFTVFTKHIEEDYPTNLPADKVATYLSEKKNLAYHEELRDHLIITSDTTVILDDRLLEKAADRSEAVEMLNQLSGRSHKVTTGVSIGINGSVNSFDETTVVHFRQLEQSEIDYYIDTYQPYDKAGAYGIQEWIGQVGITSIEGSYFNVMGLPVHKVYEALKQYQV